MKFNIVHMLGALTIAGLAIALIQSNLNSDRIININSATDNYSWSFRQSVIANTPIWENRHLEPPMHLGEATAVADKIVKKLNSATTPLKVGNWMLVGITLSPVDVDINQMNKRWFYIARFHGMRLPDHLGPPEKFDAIILMDGTVMAGNSDKPNGIDDLMNQIYP